MSVEVSLGALRVGAKIADGGQGTVYELPDDPNCVLKRYHDPGRHDFSPTALRELVAQRTGLTLRGQSVDDWAAWPAKVVLDRGDVVGFVMRKVPDQFTIALGGRRRLADLSYLAAEPRPLWGNVTLPDLPTRIGIARHLASVMDTLHQNSLVLGDLSFANVLWATSPAPRTMLLDCDGVAPLGSQPVLPRAETIDWNDPLDTPGAAATLDRDRYKLACAIVRILSRSLAVRPGDNGVLVRLGDQALDQRFAETSRAAGGAAGTRPTAATWIATLSDRQTVAVQPPAGVRVVDAPPAQPELLGSHAPRQHRPVVPPGSSAS